MLRRLVRSIRRQDGLAFAIEFLIVVVGIFVGLQVTQWNEARQLREREHIYLTRLHEDLTAMSAEFDSVLARADGPAPRSLRTFRALEACDSTLASAQEMHRTFAGYQNQPAPSIIERTYQEMLSSGALSAMDEGELSSEIAGLFSELGNYQTFVSRVRISLPVVDEVLWRHVDLSYDAEGRPVVADLDFGTVCRSRELRNALWEVYDLNWDWQVATERAAARVAAVTERLAAHLSRSGAGAP